MENKQGEVQIKINEETFKGVFSNGSIISHTQAEFLLDFISIFHQKGILCSRVIVTPQHAKMILKALSENIAMYERNFGAIKEMAEQKVNIEGLAH